MSDFKSKMLAYESLKDALRRLEESILDDLPSWRSKADAGFRYQAIMQVRKNSVESGKSISVVEAKEIVDSYLNM